MTIDHDRLGYAANLITAWIPSLDGVRDRLEAGACTTRTIRSGRRTLRNVFDVRP